ncbi:three-Cys-motif partner protein TcmP [Roseiflexus castenholzii]|uniref:three-Cys-motif partner protein TcmP n=1 Tax=Roseiflexus castenholzii TaxID=120962 RepID=UPI003C7E6193
MAYQTPKLKAVSKAKHRILQKYFPAWAMILASRHQTLAYVDCFAGSGQYADGEEGSPLLILGEARKLVGNPKFRSKILAIFVEENSQAARELESRIPTDLPDSVKAFVFPEDAHNFVPELLRVLPENLPAFLFVDPYGHPLTIPLMNQLLQRPKTEIFLTLMWYAINMHLSNPKTEETIPRMFGDKDKEWKQQPFMSQSARDRETGFVDYFLGRLDAKFKLRFRIRFSLEDKVRGGDDRTKYSLVHLSNHAKAALLMKEVMYPLGDELGPFDYSATAPQRLFSETPTVEELIQRLRENFAGQKVTFDELREKTWDWPFIEKHYREAVKTLEGKGEVRIERIESKKTGLKGKDRMTFGGGS